MKKKMYEQILDRCDLILLSKHTQLAEVETKIADIETERDKIQQRLETLKNSGTYEEYNQAKAELSRVSFNLENVKEWKRRFEQEELISRPEYEALIQEATDEASAQAEALAAELVRTAEDLYRKGTELQALLTNTNQSFQHLQNDIFKNQDQPRDKHGDPITIVNRRTVPAHFWTVATWACLLANNYAYELTTGHKITAPKPQGKHWSNTAEEGK